MLKDANEILPFATNLHVQIIICVSCSPRSPTWSASDPFAAVGLRQYNIRPPRHLLCTYSYFLPLLLFH